MNKVIVVVGLILLIVGGIVMALGWSGSESFHDKITECNSTEGQVRRSLDTNYQKECENAADESNYYFGICMIGSPFLIVGAIVMIYGAVRKEAPARPEYPPAAFPPQYPPQPPQYEAFPPSPPQFPPPPPDLYQETPPPQFPPPPPY